MIAAHKSESPAATGLNADKTTNAPILPPLARDSNQDTADSAGGESMNVMDASWVN